MKLTANPAWLSLSPHGGNGSGAKFLRIMKLTTIIILAACLHTSAKGVAQQTITFSGKEVSLESVFTAIKKQTTYRFFFNTDMLTNASKVTIDVKNAQIEQVMNMALKDQPLTFTIKGRTIFIMKKPEEEKKSVQVAPTGDPITVSGRVTDENGEPLAGANVKVKGGNNGVTTDAQGRFTLSGVDPNASLEVSFVGRETQLLAVKGKTVFSVALGQKVGTLDETVVIAYGTTTKRFNTGNVSSVKAEDISRQPVQNPILALQGRVPGLVITQNNGVPGGGVTVRVQGQNSLLNGNEPLYVIDGVPYPSQNLSTTANNNLLGSVGSGGGSPLAFVNPSDIESITVLKDADATAIYGSRAANGAILITLKKGKSGKVRLDLNVNHGWGKIERRLKMMNNVEYVAMRQEALRNSNRTPTPTADYDILNLNGWDTTRNTDWVKTLAGNTAKFSTYNATLSGGGADVQYLIGATFKRETPVFIGDFANKGGSLHFNVNNSRSNKLSFQLSGTYVVNDNKLPSLDLFSTAISLSPTAPTLYNDDGTINWGLNSAGSSTWTNPLARVFNYYQSKANNLISNFQIGYQLMRNLTIKSDFSYNKLDINTFNGFRLKSIAPQNLATSQRSANYSYNTISTWLIEPQLNFTHDFHSGALDILLGSTFQKTSNEGNLVNGTGYNSDDVLRDMRSAASLTSTSSVISKYNYNALFARANYNLLDKYIVNVNARRDGSSRFGRNNQLSNFGSVGLAWIITQEKFLKKLLSTINFAKLRASYGITGNDQIGDYAFLSLYDPVSVGIAYQGQIGLTNVSLTNADLKWEKTKKTNVGLDLGVLNNKFLFSGSYVINQSSNQLLFYPLSLVTGFGGILKNLNATVENRLIELQLSYNLKGSGGFAWTSSMNATFAKNRLKSFEDIEKSSYNNFIVGQPIDVKRNYKYLGVDPITGLYQFEDSKGSPTSTPNSELDRTVLISAFPRFYGGWANTFTYNRFEVSILFQFQRQLGGTYKYGNLISYAGNPRTNQPAEIINNHWVENGDVKAVQKYGSTGISTNSLMGESDAVNGNDIYYIKLKNMSFSYIISNQLLKRIKVNNCKFYIQGQNVFTVTNYVGFDPENVGSISTSPLRVIAIGLQLGI